jgi:CysZ protein
VLSDLAKSLAVLGDRAFWATAAKSILLTLPMAIAAAWIGIEGVEALPDVRWAWINWLIQAVGVVGAVFVALMLFPAFASMVVGLFLDDIAEATEQRFYPGDPPGKALGVAAATGQGLRLMLLVIGVNLLVLPLYVICIFFPPLSFGLYYAVNGWLLSREYFGMVATRHVDPVQERALRRAQRGRVFLAGCLIAFLFTIPIVNLAAPLIGTALMVHVFKGVSARA